MLKDKNNQLSIYSILYNKIPENHTLKLIVVSFQRTLIQIFLNIKKLKAIKKQRRSWKKYLQGEISKVEDIISHEKQSKNQRVIDNAKEILKDLKFIEQREVRSVVDQEARVGHKSKTSTFFGYKTEYMITTDERIITAVIAMDGAYVDGTEFDKLIELTQKTGLDIKEVYGDKAYFKRPILDKIKEAQAKSYIPVSEMAYKIDEELSWIRLRPWVWFKKHGYTSKINCISNKLKEDSSYTILQHKQ